jgi:hypothetical protein
MLFLHGDYEQALPLAEAGLALYEQTDNQWGIRNALGIVGYITGSGNYDTRTLSKSLRLSREIGDIDGMSWSLSCWETWLSIRAILRKPWLTIKKVYP